MDLDIKNNLELVKARISKAAERAGRLPETVRLVAAGKGVTTDRLREAIHYGIDIIGENRVQEALIKIKEIGMNVPSNISWHMIGRLQRNKVKDVVGRFDLIHSVDSKPLAGEIDKWAGRINVIQKVLLEVNVGGEETKSGIFPDRTLGLIKEIAVYKNILIRGLMTIPPITKDPEGSRRFFRILGELAKDITKEGIERVMMGELSMGMSDDFEIAVEEGATFVRIGRAIFGPRRG